MPSPLNFLAPLGLLYDQDTPVEVCHEVLAELYPRVCEYALVLAAEGLSEGINVANIHTETPRSGVGSEY